MLFVVNYVIFPPLCKSDSAVISAVLQTHLHCPWQLSAVLVCWIYPCFLAPKLAISYLSQAFNVPRKTVRVSLHKCAFLNCSGFHDTIGAQIPQQWTDGKWEWTCIKLLSFVLKAKYLAFVFWAEHFPFHVKWLKTEKQEDYLLSIIFLLLSSG